ncbi:hypothetical protein TOPH_09131 [Tolypocladium ophioglossoides CBS 100239]|uniref:Protein kinase domain-containing protein n=1 Tax=Tolypocladium ophioglossoides (strain CBS 100239) TaxID=1163406 RepID=A0A0L0MWK0_TOLOC|nr:hypothetical protein TOPH_09131 [Tolypocladium ophioglossoides CBS 100239]
MALTQVFYYMVRCGVAYGYVAAGKCLVLLHIDRADLQTLYYHLCVPDEEVTAETSAEGWASQASHTAVAQLASFCLLSLRSEALKGEALDAALLEAEKELKEWGTPYDDAAQLHGGDGADSSSTTSSSGSDGSDFKLEASPATRKYPLRSRSSCKTAEVLGGEDDEEDEDGGGRDLSQIRTRNKEGARKQGEGAPDARTPGMMAEVQRSSRAVRAEGVYHGDERGPNRLWNEERRSVMLIDFDRATGLPASKHK